MKKMVTDEASSRKADLATAIRDIWNLIDDYSLSLVKSRFQRIQAVINARGGARVPIVQCLKMYWVLYCFLYLI